MNRLLTYLILLIVAAGCGEPKTSDEIFKEILNDSRINSREVGESEGIKYFQVIENDKYGF